MMLRLSLFPLLFTLVASAQDNPIVWPKIRWERITAGNFDSITNITNAKDGSGRLFISEQAGRVKLWTDGEGQFETLFLDISERVTFNGERGLNSIAFPPGFASKQYFYVNYINKAGNTVVSRFNVLAEKPNQADPASEKFILGIAQDSELHKAGQMFFGPDGFLYISTGDGGDGNGDKKNSAQNPKVLLGKMLRIDTENAGDRPYVIPPTNPFIEAQGYLPEIWARGLRNPWRFSFDRATGDIYIGDVGENTAEEINFQPSNSGGGENYGWVITEGSGCFVGDPCSKAGITMPVYEYAHENDNCSVIGGFVYRGPSYPAANGIYLFADYCTGNIGGLARNRDGWQYKKLLFVDKDISTFGEDESGELFFSSYSEGLVFRLIFEQDKVDAKKDVLVQEKRVGNHAGLAEKRPARVTHPQKSNP